VKRFSIPSADNASRGMTGRFVVDFPTPFGRGFEFARRQVHKKNLDDRRIVS
jgi:hypothetical protein